MKNQLDKEQTAKLLDITLQTLELWIKKKFGPKPIWIGKVVRFDKLEVEAFAKKLMLTENTKAGMPIKKRKQRART